MYFKQIDEIVNGTKTQTRRIVKPGEYMLASTLPDTLYDDEDPSDYIWQCVYTAKHRLKWADRRDYAVQPGRGKPGVWWNGVAKTWRCEKPDVADHSLGWQPLRIRLLEIRREPLGAISEADAVAEGCTPIFCSHCISNEALHGIVLGNDCPACNGSQIAVSARDEYRDLWESINGPKSWERDKDKDVWPLTFEVVQ